MAAAYLEQYFDCKSISIVLLCCTWTHTCIMFAVHIHFISGVEALPVDLQRCITELREIERQTQGRSNGHLLFIYYYILSKLTHDFQTKVLAERLKGCVWTFSLLYVVVTLTDRECCSGGYSNACWMQERLETQSLKYQLVFWTL